MIYLFKTHYSGNGKSIIQVEDALREGKEPYTFPNLTDICVKNGIKDCFLVEDSMAGIIPIEKCLSGVGIQTRFGLRLSFVTNAEDANSESNKSSHKNIIFCKTFEGYQKLIKISTAAHTTFFNKQPRIDYNFLHSIWSDDDLQLAVPCYDSFIFNNLFTFNTCIPDFRGIKPTMFLENHDLIFDQVLPHAIKEYAENAGLEVQDTCSVYYENPDDFIAWKSRKLMNRQHGGKAATLENPNLSHCTSNTFCIQ